MCYKQSRCFWIPPSEFTSCGHQGDRYRKKESQGMPVVKLFIKTCEINQRDFQTLSLLSSSLSEGLKYEYRKDNDEQDVVSIELVAVSDVEKLE